MRRAVLVGPKLFVLEEVPIPQPVAHEVIVKVERAGICGSDLHAYSGTSRIKPPVVLGHEFSGTIHAVGSAAQGVAVGERVTVEPGVSCGKCTYCQCGRYNLCVEHYMIGGRQGHDGAYADYVRVPADKVIALPESMSFEVGAMVEPVACAMHALDVAHIRCGDTVLVIGAGTMGLLVAQAVRMAGVSTVAIADVVPQRLALAEQLGVDAAADLRDTDLVLWAKEKYGEGGIHCVLDTVGIAKTFEQSLQIVRRGGRIVNLGISDQAVEWRPSWLRWEIELTGMKMHTRRNFDQALNAISSGRVRVEPLISTSYPLANIEEAFHAALHDPQRVKILLAPQTG